MASLKDVMAVQETKLASASAAWEMTEQGHQHLEAKCQKLCSTCSGKPPLYFASFLFSVVVSGCELVILS